MFQCFSLLSFHYQQPGNPENEEELKDGEKKDSESDVMEKSGKEAWNDFKKKVEELLKKILPESKRKEIIESVKNATCSTPKVCINDITYLMIHI